jgi:allophanate hydrolase subunit 2
MITVVRAGPLTTVQDLGRPGYAHLGVPRSGALDPPAARLANALVGNPESAAVLETTLMGCALRFSEPARVAVTGASAVVSVDGSVLSDVVRADGPRSVVVRADGPVLGVVDVQAGSVLDVGRATAGVRSYVAVAGGIDVQPVLGSRRRGPGVGGGRGGGRL